MRNFLLIVMLTVLCTPLLAHAAAPERDAPGAGESLARLYFVALTEGDTKTADKIVTTPYYLDRKAVLKTLPEVKKLHQKILASKGKRKVPVFTVTISDTPQKLDPEIFPPHTAYKIRIEGAKDTVNIYVTNGPEPRIIGFDD